MEVNSHPQFVNSLPEELKEYKPVKIEDVYIRRFRNYKNFTEKRIEWIKEQTKNELIKENELRKNIRVLIVLGSAVEKIATYPTYIKNNEDIVTTFLLEHLFKFACGIPEEQIFLTSSNPANFPQSPDVISSLTSFSKGKSKAISVHDFIIQDYYSNPTDFRYYRSIFAQVGEYQYQFYSSYWNLPLILPFNKEYISLFKTDENSELFVFFLDHSSPSNFQNNKYYEFFVERLLQIPSKHIYLFNDTCNSGSLIDLIHISDKIHELFFNDSSSSSKNKISQTQIFKMLMNASHTTSKDSTQDMRSKNETKTTTNENKNEINHIKEKVDSENVENEEKISEIMKYLTKTSDRAKNDLISLIEHMKIYDSDLSIDPVLFHKLKGKSFILCSTPFNLKSPTLPYRHFYIAGIDTISAHGSVFSSIIIDCLFHPNKEDINPDFFISHIQTIHNYMKKQFFPILREQYTHTQTSDEHIDKMKPKRNISKTDLELYFNINYANNCVFSCPDNFTLPNMKSILLTEKYWNVDITPVDVHEYDHLKIFDYNSFDPDYVI